MKVHNMELIKCLIYGHTLGNGTWHKGSIHTIWCRKCNSVIRFEVLRVRFHLGSAFLRTRGIGIGVSYMR